MVGHRWLVEPESPHVVLACGDSRDQRHMEVRGGTCMYATAGDLWSGSAREWRGPLGIAPGIARALQRACGEGRCMWGAGMPRSRRGCAAGSWARGLAIGARTRHACDVVVCRVFEHCSPQWGHPKKDPQNLVGLFSPSNRRVLQHRTRPFLRVLHRVVG